MLKRIHVFLPILSCACVLSGCSSASSSWPAPDPANQLPIGFVDSPTADALVRREFSAHGWALDEGRLVAVRCYLDGRFVGQASTRLPRPDVRAAHPALAKESDLHGWQVNLTIPQSAGSGPHVLIVQAVDDHGATRDIGVLQLRVE